MDSVFHISGFPVSCFCLTLIKFATMLKTIQIFSVVISLLNKFSDKFKDAVRLFFNHEPYRPQWPRRFRA